MMDCAAYKRALLADPQHPTAEMRQHVAACHECQRYTEQVLRFEGRLERALRVPVGTAQDGTPVPLRANQAVAARPVAARPLRRPGWLAMAASALLAAVVAGSLWLAAPGSSLAADVVNHMAEEPQAWSRTDVPVPAPKLDEVLGESHVRLKSNAGLVSYANSCLFRGHQVPHLVVQTAKGPVTVMVLTHETLNKAVRFDEQGYRGMVIPVPAHGSLAVLERGPNTDMETVKGVAARVIESIEWTN